MTYTNWKVKSQDISLVNNLSFSLGCSEIVSKLLINRGLTDIKSASAFLSNSADCLHDPFLLNDMDKATDRIVSAIKKNEKIVVYGDYDVDGITSVSSLYLYLKNFTDNVSYYIPDRFSQGYGVNDIALDKINNSGCDLMITVDTGISAVSEVEYANSLGIDVIITDHHECQDNLPIAFAVINPKRHDSTYPFAKLAGVGVIYKLITALDRTLGCSFADRYIDLVAIGTVADIMPLIDENRYIVKSGLEKLRKEPNLGLKCLIDMCVTSPTVTSGTVGFAIAPRINAAGRMESAEVAVELFITQDVEKANSIASHLCELNTQRQFIENKIYNEAIEIIETEELDKRFNALVLWKEGWHSGIIGIVASKLKEKFNKPVVLFSVDEVSKGSGRSVIPFNLYETFEKNKDILIQYGGHKYAAGVLLENDKLKTFRNNLSDSVGEFLKTSDFSNDIDIECDIPHNMVTCKTASDIALLQPYGKSNEVPVFRVKNVKIVDLYSTSNNKHLRIKFLINNKNITGFYFGKTLKTFDYREGDLVDIICELNENEFKNIKSVQLIIHDMRYGDNIIESMSHKRYLCDKVENIVKSMLPSRNDIGGVYRFLVQGFSNGKRLYNLDTLTNMINNDALKKLNFEKVYFSVKILLELNIITGEIDDNELSVTTVAEGKKFSLSDSEILMCIYNKAGAEFGSQTKV